VSLAAERQHTILELLQKQKTLKVRDLIEQLKVSQMTIHRDLRDLAAAGMVTKVHGGVTLTGMFPVQGALSNVCSLCGNPVPTRTAMIIHGFGGELLYACCPHCGLILLSRQEGSVMALTADFLYGQMASVREVVYLVESVLDICCAPSMLSFVKLQDAQRFQQGFGGRLMDFNQAQQYLQAGSDTAYK
jgi:hypothetical protein